MSQMTFHQVESFVARNGDDQVRLQDFVVFCHPTEPDSESEPKVSNISYVVNRCCVDTFD